MDPFARPVAGTQVTSVPKVFGVLSIVFAAITLLSGLMWTTMGGLPWLIGGFAKNDPKADEILGPMKTIYGGIGAIGLVLVVMSAFLIAIGVGQLKYRRWARSWSVWWGELALLGVVGMIAISLLAIGPGYREMMTAATSLPGHAPTDMGMLSSVFGGMFSGMFVLFYAPYPILLVAFFTREKVRDAMIY